MPYIYLAVNEKRKFHFCLQYMQKKVVFFAEMQYDVIKWVKRGVYYDLQRQNLGHYRHPGQYRGG